LNDVDGNHAENCRNESGTVRIDNVLEEVDVQLNTTEHTIIHYAPQSLKTEQETK